MNNSPPFARIQMKNIQISIGRVTNVTNERTITIFHDETESVSGVEKILEGCEERVTRMLQNSFFCQRVRNFAHLYDEFFAQDFHRVYVIVGFVFAEDHFAESALAQNLENRTLANNLYIW
jgi:hypothetical protein